MHDEELINSGFNPGTRAMILVTVILALAMALSPGIRTTQQVEGYMFQARWIKPSEV